MTTASAAPGHAAALDPAALEEVVAWFGDRAAGIDGGRNDVREGLEWLGVADLIAPGGAGLPHAVTLVEAIAGSV